VLTTQICFLAQALVLTILFVSGHASIVWIMCLSLAFGFICVFDIPGRQAFLVDMIDKKEDLPNAIAIHSIMFNATRIAGPAMAGLLIAAHGEGLCFVVNTLSYLAPVVVLLKMSTARSENPSDHAIIRGMVDGFNYLKAHTELKNALLLLAMMSFAGMPFTVLMPIFAKDILRGGPHTMGFLMAATGAGALLGAFYLANKRQMPDIGNKIRAACVLFGVSMTAFSLARNFSTALFLTFLAGFGMMIQMNLTNILLQVRVHGSLRGRMMSFYTMAFLGVTPFGGLLAGIAAARWGAPVTTAVGGAVCVLAAYSITIGKKEVAKSRAAGA
ncbi:MAG: MFS transporter, partial [Candidatus Omnitrophota bacterium]